ncbi:hypothetical protein EON81_17855, partial [bacterium]
MLSFLLGLAVPARPLQGTPAESRIRIVPQYSAGLVQDIEESRDGSRLITHDKGYAPRLWDARRQVLLRALDGHPDPVALTNFSLDGTRVLTRSPRLVRVWDSARAKIVADYAIPEGEAATAAVFSPDGKTVAIGSDKGTVTLYGATAPQKLGAHTKAVRSLAFSPDGARLVSGSDDATGRFWDLKAGQPLTALTGHKGAIRWFDFSPRGELLATSLDNTASLWDASGKAMAVYPQVIGERGVENVAMAAVFVGKEFAEIAACDKDGTIQLYKPGATKPSRALAGHADSIRELRRSHDGRYLATYANDNTLRMWDVGAGKELDFDPASDTPTAGEFSPGRDVFWLGYLGGEVRQFDIKTGKATKETFGAVTTVDTASLIGEEARVYWRGQAGPGSFGTVGESQHFFLDPNATAAPVNFEWALEHQEISPDGRYLAGSSRAKGYGFLLVDVADGTILLKNDSLRDFSFSPDGSRIAIMDGDSGEIGIFDLKSRKFQNVWTLETNKAWGGITGPYWHPNGSWDATAHHPGNQIYLWDVDSGEILRKFEKDDNLHGDIGFDAHGDRMVVRSEHLLRSYDLDANKRVWERKDLHTSVWDQLSVDGDRFAVLVENEEYMAPEAGREALILDNLTGKDLLHIPGTTCIAISKDGKRAIAGQGKLATVWDIDKKTKLLTLVHPSAVVSVSFGPDDQRLVTADSLEGLHVWNEKGKESATMVAMKDGSWLVYDDQGRYDASDPSNVVGAKFVLDWEGGLEPISMAQLKGQFYEPHLLAKALGTDKEPLRDVPDLESLRLFPELTVKPTGGLTYDIESKERDNGGIGTVRVSINGKEVVKKKGTGFFKLDLAAYESFLLPESRLGEGEKNRLTVTVSNESGELVSPPEILDIGTPADLKVPDVKLYALCVGIGDYAGKGGDLLAPPSDASSIGQALKEVSDRLLPGKTEITVMSTAGESPRPTRNNILGWLKEVGAKATSSDIVFLFVAGHGTNKIGDQSGYFMLTSEADPGDITAATIKTGAISGEELRAALAAIPAGKQVVVLDTCHSGAVSDTLIAADRSISGEYQRAYEAIKDTTGTWLLAGAAADQKSYESPNVDHGMLTYALLETIDKGSSDGLRKTPSGELFVDVERWLTYAA